MDGIGNNARFNYPWGIEFDSQENVLYVADCVSIQGILCLLLREICGKKAFFDGFCVGITFNVSIYTGIYVIFNTKYSQFCSLSLLEHILE